MTVWRGDQPTALPSPSTVACTAPSDAGATTHHVRQSLRARFWMVPFNTGWHLAHHVDIRRAVPAPPGAAP